MPALTLQVAGGQAPQQWKPLQFHVIGVPASANPFDPDSITVDAIITFPSGKTLTVPGCWFQEYKRKLFAQAEQLIQIGQPEWRIRFTPSEGGKHTISVAITLNGVPNPSAGSLAFNVPKWNVTSARGYVGLDDGGPDSPRYFRTSHGDPLALVGENLCWYRQNGKFNTYDYDKWLGYLAQSGVNSVRIWMAPTGTPFYLSFGIECVPGTLTRYSLGEAWRLDYVMGLAETLGIYVMLCLDFQSVFEKSGNPYGNNCWPTNPYNANVMTSGLPGPCNTPNDFFALSAAKKIYKKRLRYLIARYGYRQKLLCWEFFNEINQLYSPHPAGLIPADVSNWHSEMGQYLKANDPFHHLITTSTVGTPEAAPELWGLWEIDFGQVHSYGMNSPTIGLANIARGFYDTYQKPFLIGEYGVDGSSLGTSVDPYYRGLRQGIWSGALNGSAGTGMSWWWEKIGAATLPNGSPLYSYFLSLSTILRPTSWGNGTWYPVDFNVSFPTSSLIAIGMTRPAAQEMLVYVVNPDADYPKNATTPSISPLVNGTLGLNVGQGTFEATWYDPVTAMSKGRAPAVAHMGGMQLSLPTFSEDLVGRIVRVT